MVSVPGFAAVWLKPGFSAAGSVRSVVGAVAAEVRPSVRHAITAAGSFTRCGSGGGRGGCHGLGLLSRRRAPRLAFAPLHANPGLRRWTAVGSVARREVCVCAGHYCGSGSLSLVVCVWWLVQCTPLFVAAGRSLWGEVGAVGAECTAWACVCVCVCAFVLSVGGCTPLWPRWSEGAPGIQRRRLLPCPVRGGDGVPQYTS